MEQMIKATGRLRYSTRSGANKRANPWWLVVDTHKSITDFYRHQVERNLLNPLRLEKGLRLQAPMWGAHVTVLDGRKEVAPDYRDRWGIHEGEKIEFEYSPNVQQIWKFWVLPVRSKRLEEIRAELGLAPTYRFHLTVGRFV